MKISRRQTGKIAKSYVVAELTKRDYIVKEEINNLSVKSPKGKTFMVKVTSLSKPNVWLININPKNKDYYFILVFMPEINQTEFFILTGVEMLKEKQNHFSAKKKPLDEYKNPDLEKLGLNFNQAFPYKDKWNSLPR